MLILARKIKYSSFYEKESLQYCRCFGAAPASGGFGGVLKNASIGVASQNGKAYIHTAGKVQDWHKLWTNLPDGWMFSPEKNTPFIESMSAAAQAVHNYFKGREGIVYRAEESGLGSTKYMVVSLDD